MHEIFTNAQRIVIKIGSALVTDLEKGTLRAQWLKTLVDDIMQLRKQGKEIVIVSSGAVALGRKSIHSEGVYAHTKLEEKQAAAACGQITLIAEYQACFSQYDQTVAQLLLTLEDSENRRRYLNARSTLSTLLENNVVPIVNENDTVATDGIRVGDNDRLAARVAQMVSADILILLSDIDGLYTADPRIDDKAEHIDTIPVITDNIRSMAGDSGTFVGSGGMVTKIDAAEIATVSGCHMIITKGYIDHPVQAILNGARNSLFVSNESPQSARKHWIAAMIQPLGIVYIDAGAEKALQEEKSLLPVGVTAIEGEFDRGDLVVIHGPTGDELGQGLIAYSSDDAERIIGKRSSEIESILGYAGRGVLIHRDDLVLSDLEPE